ncbi:hypothetical protein GF376_04290 [Candidatus Peregrinibacteria bacterium]|nr:hypothetical protein [Candidatus Peregrinibacteria bacterium]
MKKLAIIIMSVLVFNNIVVFAKDFPDVSNTHANYVAIDYLSDQGVLSGYEDGNFQPDKLVNRAEALKIIFEGLGLEINSDLEQDNLFSDVNSENWFAKYVAHAKNAGIINGNPDGTYAPSRNVARAEFLKMLLNSIGFKSDQWEDLNEFEDVSEGEWYTPFMNYAGKAGLLSADESGKLYPSKNLSRGEVSEILYLLLVILSAKDTQFLIDQAEAQMAQIELLIANKNISMAKRSAELAVDMTQQAYRNMPDNDVVLGAAKIARGYDYLVNSYVSALNENYSEAEDWANQVIEKATEAWEVNNDTQPIARHLKDRAREILTQVEEFTQ